MELRAITDEDVPAYRRTMISTFGGDPEADKVADDRLRALLRIPGRAWGAFDGGACVATAGTFEQTVSMPGGGELAMAGLTMVTVRPTHRRRGILRGMIDVHLADQRAHGEPVSGLWASEASIYGRFGYGLGTQTDDLVFDARGVEVALRGTADTIDELDDAKVTALLSPVFGQIAGHRPGLISRSPAWWAWRRLRDRDDQRKGASPRRYHAAWRDGIVTGWIASRQRLAWTDGGVANGSFEIDELFAVDPRAEASLWRFVSAIDLFPVVRYWNAPTDALLPWLVPDPRRVRRVRTDAMWVRVDDVAASFSARNYASDGQLVLGVEDHSFALEVQGGVGQCTPTTAPPTLVCDRGVLGSLLLGGVSPFLLARAGRLAGDVVTAERLFPWPTPPWTAEIF